MGARNSFRETPCSSYSRARKNDGGPPPLRSASSLWGLSGLKGKDMEKVELGNKFMTITVDLALFCFDHNVPGSIENPAGSFLWLMPPMIELVRRCRASRIELDMCRFGSPHMKPTAIVGTFKLIALALRCDRDRRPHQHDPLSGTVVVNGKKMFKTRLAQVYPVHLCQQWAAEICSQLQRPKSGDGSFSSDVHHGNPKQGKEEITGATCALVGAQATGHWRESSSCRLSTQERSHSSVDPGRDGTR